MSTRRDGIGGTLEGVKNTAAIKRQNSERFKISSPLNRYIFLANLHI